MASLLLFIISTLSLNSAYAKDIDFAYSFKDQKLKPIDYSVDYKVIIIQEHCPSCHQVYKYMDKQKTKTKNTYLASTYEPSKRWMKLHTKYISTYGIYSAGNLIREEGVYAKATPSLYSWNSKTKKGLIEYGLKPIIKILETTK